MRTQKSMNCTCGAGRCDRSTRWTWPHAGKTPAWLDAAGSGSWHCKWPWSAWGLGLLHAASMWLFAGKGTVSQKPRGTASGWDWIHAGELMGAKSPFFRQAKSKVDTVVDAVHSSIWEGLTTWNQHIHVCQGLYLKESLLCCSANHYGPLHRAVSTGETWKGTWKAL